MFVVLYTWEWRQSYTGRRSRKLQLFRVRWAASRVRCLVPPEVTVTRHEGCVTDETGPRISGSRSLIRGLNFRDKVCWLTDDTLGTVRIARTAGLLLAKVFTSRLGNQSEPVPIGDDECGRYNMLSFDGFLINETRFEGID